MKLHKTVFILCLTVAFVLANNGCSISRAINTTTIGEHKIYFKRRVWGLNGDKVWITTNSDICQDESLQTDYISNSMIIGDRILYKVEGEKLYVFGSTFLSPKEFPVEIKIVVYEYDSMNPNRDMKNEGYQKMDLGNEKMTTCISDIF